jgi:outer membrane protein assembly factor BamB
MENVNTGEALQGFQLGGEFVFAEPAGLYNQQAAVDPKGHIYAGGSQANQVRIFNTAGALLDTAVFGITGNTSVSAPSIGSDGTLYFGQSFAPPQLVGTNPQSGLKWTFPVNGIVGSPQVNPANTLVVAGSYVIGGAGTVQAVNASTGALSWQVALPRDPEGFVWPMSAPRFSANGAVVYLGMDISENENNPYTYLYAFDAQ